MIELIWVCRFDEKERRTLAKKKLELVVHNHGALHRRMWYVKEVFIPLLF